VIYIIRYPDLDTRIPAASNVTTTTTTTAASNNNNITTDDVLSYHLKKLEEVGYRSIQIINSTEVRLNLTNPQTNETIATEPARLVEMAYSTNFAPNETRTGYFISTATNATPPNLGTTKGYAVFYEGGNSTTTTTNNTTAAEITTTASAASGSLAPTPPPTPVRHVFDSFELIAAPEVAQASADEAQAAQTAESDDGANDDNGDDDGANDDNGDDDGANDDNGDDDDDGAEGDEGEGNASPNQLDEFEGCTTVGRGDVGDVGC
jgi:hypothetical protein